MKEACDDLEAKHEVESDAEDPEDGDPSVDGRTANLHKAEHLDKVVREAEEAKVEGEAGEEEEAGGKARQATTGLAQGERQRAKPEGPATRAQGPRPKPGQPSEEVHQGGQREDAPPPEADPAPARGSGQEASRPHGVGPTEGPRTSISKSDGAGSTKNQTHTSWSRAQGSP